MAGMARIGWLSMDCNGEMWIANSARNPTDRGEGGDGTGKSMSPPSLRILRGTAGKECAQRRADPISRKPPSNYFRCLSRNS